MKSESVFFYQPIAGFLLYCTLPSYLEEGSQKCVFIEYFTSTLFIVSYR
jgi:hypothetical protein